MSRSSANPIQDYTYPEEHITTCYDSNPGFKLCTKKLYRYQRSYYIDTSVLLENIPLVKFIKTTSGTRVVYFPWSHTWVYRRRDFRNFHPKFVGVLRLLNFTYTFFKVLLIVCHCRILFRSVLFLKIIVNSVLYCCTVNLSRHDYFLAKKNLLFYRCHFVYIIKRTLHGG